MFNLKHPISIRLQRWMSVVLALGVFSFAPLTAPLTQSANAVITNPAPDCSAVTTCTITFTYSTNDYFQWAVPAGITSVTFDVRGSQGGGAGGYGGKVVGTLTVSSFSNLFIYVGSTSGYNGGGARATGLGSHSGQAGGGASDIRTSASGSNYTDRLIVAGGGGGTGAGCTGNATSGAGGGLTGANGCNSRGMATGGTQVGGGTGGSNATAGVLGVGGNGGYCGGAGGGGGGYYGGGGGGSDYPGWCDNDDANGAGGSSYTNATYVSGVTHTQGAVTGNGSVFITYPNGPSISSSGGLSVAGTFGVTLLDTITSAGGTGTRTLTMNTPNTGVSFNPTSGLVTITGAAVGSFTQIFTVTDSGSPQKTNSITVTFTINAAPTASLTSSTIATTVGRTASETMTVSNGTGTKTFALTSSVTQAGITLTNPSAGVAVLNIAATNVAAGTYIETITATDTAGARVVSVITVTINAATTLVGETTTALVVTSGRSRLETLTASNGTGVKSFVLSSVSPTNAGITLDTSTASSGYSRLNVSSSVAAGTYTAIVTATDTKGSVGTLTKTITVNQPLTFALGSTSTFGVPSGTAGYDTLTVSGGTAPRTVTIVGSPSNSGVTVSAPNTSQVVMNVASTVPAATYLETITVTDAAGATAAHTVTLTVSGPIRFDSSNPTTINTSVGRSASARIATLSGNTGKVFTKTSVSSPSSAAITLDTSTAANGYVTLNVSGAALAGSYVESITVVDSSNSRATWTVTVNVNPPPVLTYETSTAGSNFSSLVFNGTNQYVTVPSNANLVMGSNYTIEWWQYQTDSNSYPRIFSFGGNGLEVSIEGGTFYYWLNGSAYILASGVSVKNAWTHFAIVSRNNSIILYKNGVAQRAAATGVAVTTSNLPSTGNLCIGSECNTTYYSMFGGRIANFTISNTPRYSGTSLSVASFTPGFFSTVDANTLLALGAVNSEAKFTDSSSFSRTVSYLNTPTGNSSHPSGGSGNIAITTTQGITKRSSAFVASAGTGTKTFSISPSVDGITLDTSLANNATIVIADTVTATNPTTARIINETVTATDSLGASTKFNVAITVNPPIVLTATATSFSSTAGLMGYDTITATTGTGTGAITYSLQSNPTSSGITLVPGTSRNAVLTVARTVPSGTYYETVTATDSLGATSSILITLTVNPGITLAGEGGITTLTTSNGAAAQLKVIASNGASGKSFSMQAASVATNAGITIDPAGAASGFALVKVAATVPANTYLETITVTDSQGGTAKLLVTVIVNPAPSITGPTSITVTAGKAAATNAFTSSSGTGLKTLTLTGLNSGISIDTSTTNAGIVNLSSSLTSTNSTTVKTIYETVTATDQSGAVARAALRITVNPAVIETATATSITTTSGVVRTVTVYATQGTGNKTFTRTSAVASSAITMTTLIANQAVLTIGALTSPGTYYETITATDTLNASTTILITITVNGPPTVSGTTNLYTTQGVAFNSPLFRAFSGNGTYTFSLVSNPTAAGITVSSPTAGYARISVASTVASGTYNETLTVTDGLGATGFMTFTIRVNAPVALTGTQTVSTTYGSSFTTGYNTSGGTGPFTFSTSDVCTVSRSTFTGNGSNGTVNGTSYTVDQIFGAGSCNWVVPNGVNSVSSLIVSGGGGGGGGGYVLSGSGGGGGGGGGGGIATDSRTVTSGSVVAVVIGSGGTLGTGGSTSGWNGNSAGNGGASSVFGVNATLGGGGYGAGIDASSGQCTANRTWTDGSGGYGGNSGSYSGGAKTCTVPGGGGGGASVSSAGGAPSSAVGGNGATGVTSYLTGSAVVYGSGGRGGDASTAGEAGSIGTTPGGGGSGGNGRNQGTAGNGGKGVSGLVALRYVTPTEDPAENLINFTSASAGSSSTAGLINLSIGLALPAGSYSKTVIATDSTGASSSTVTVNITVAKANPVITLSLPGAATSTQYGFGVLLSAQASTAGTVQFRDNGTEISGCGSKTTSSFVATCRWVPNVVATRTISAVFTPTDTANYNSGITTTMSVVVSKADTLTVTSLSENFTFTNSAAAVTERFTLDGLAEIDSVTVSAGSITTTYSGTANDSSTLTSTTAPAKAGENYAITPSALVFASGSASNYVNIQYVPGVLTIARAVNNGTFNYSSSNQLTYSPGGVDTPTVTTFGEATPAFTGANPEKCSINSSTGALSILEAGTCLVTMDVPKGYNYLATSVIKSVVINKAARTISLSSAGASIKYGDTATVTTTISGGSSDGVLTYTSSFPSVCQYDEAGGEILALLGSGTCSITAQIAAGTNYLSATSNTLSVTAALADAPVITTNTLDPVSYNYGNAISVTPTFTAAGLKLSDTAGSVTFTYAFLTSPAGSFSYSSTSVPTEGGIYTVTPSGLTLSSGSLSNYQTPNYVSSNLEVEQIDQPDLVITNLTGELTFPIKLITNGGSPTITTVVYLVTASTATNCRVAYGPITAGGESIWNLQADSAGSCSIRAGKLQTRNYRTVISETATVSVLQFVSNVQQPILNFGSGVTLSSSIPITLGETSCTSNCTPTISSATPDFGYVGDMIVLTGTNFTGATKIIFNTFINATNFSNDPADPDRRITVQVPVGVPEGDVGIEVVTPGGTSFRAIVFELIP